MDLKFICFVFSIVLSLCDSAFVDTINKCSFKDDECVTKIIQDIVKYVSEKGMKEFNIPAFDPLDLAGLSIPVLGIVNVTVEEGTATGVKDCVIKHVHNDFEALVTEVESTCDLTIKIMFKLEDIGTAAQKLFGSEAKSGSGSISMKVDKVNIKLKFTFKIIKKDDGNIYIIPNDGDIASILDVENLTLKAEKIFIADQDISDIIEKLVKENWKSFMPTFGKSIFKVAANIILKYVLNFFGNVPAKDYYTDDLNPYL